MHNSSDNKDDSKALIIDYCHILFYNMYARTEDYFIAIYLTWMIMIGFFIALTIELMY